jgi:predicted dehydrogenase
MHDEPGAKTVAYVDIDEQNLDWAHERFAAPKETLFTDLQQALDNIDADGVILVTPPMVRYEQCLQVIEKGLPILAEKPLTPDFARAVQVTRTAAEHDVPLVGGFNFRYLNVTQESKRLFESGELGQPSFARVYLYWHRTGKRPGGNRYPLVMDHPMLLEQSIHALDLIRYVYGSEIKSLWAATHNPPWSPYVGDATATAVLELENGMLVNYLGTWMGQSLVREYDWRTDCTKGTLFQRSMFSDLYIARAGSDTLEPVQIEKDQPFIDDTRKLLREFITSLDSIEPHQGGKDNLKSMAATCACIESAQTGMQIEMVDFYRKHGVTPLEIMD